VVYLTCGTNRDDQINIPTDPLPTLRNHENEKKSPRATAIITSHPTFSIRLPYSISMLQPAARAVARRNILSTALRPALRAAPRPHSRTLFTSPAAKKSSFKSAFVRWAAVGGLIYCYSTSGVFADEPKCMPLSFDLYRWSLTGKDHRH